MILHAVLFSFKEQRTAPERTEFLSAAQELSSISGVEKFEIRKQTNPKNTFEYGISMEFSDSSVYSAYNEHPLHKAFIKNFWLPNIEKFLEFDLEPSKSA